jgi:Arc/MetJ-type ribon-helix-helix transcriptional regulator
MNAPPKSIIQKTRGRPFNPQGIDPVISFRMDYHLEMELEHWRNLRPKPPSRSRAIRVLLRRALAAEKEREDGSSDQKTEAQSSGA